MANKWRGYHRAPPAACLGPRYAANVVATECPDSQANVLPGSFPRIFGLPTHAYLVYRFGFLRAYPVYIYA